MRPLCPGLHVIVLDLLLLFWLSRAKGEGDGLGAKQTHPSTAYLTAFPISPQDWVRSGFGRRLRWRRLHHSRRRCSGLRWRLRPNRWVGRDWPTNRTDAPRFDGRSGFLTLLSERTGAAMRHPSTVEDAHRAVLFRSSFLCRQGMTSRTAYRSIGLQRKI